MENPLQFLKKKYNLHATPEVASATKRTEMRTGEKVPQNPVEQMQNYLNRFKEVIDRKNPAEREQGMEALKKILLRKFVTKYEEIPKNWHDLNERIIRERGQGGDWNRYSEDQKEKERKQQAEAVLADQEASLEQWIDYMASQDSSYMPDYFKYWVFRNITELSEYDKEKTEFPKRSKGTVKMFPDINQEALGYVIDAVIKKQKGENFSFDRFEADLSDNQKNIFKQNLEAENFAKLYGWANEQIHPIAKHLLSITEGEWIKYDKDDEATEHYKLLNQSIRGRGTGWCTAGENTAKTQLQGGDFYCYYTLDDDSKPKIPRIAIRMQEGKIAEVRGIAYRQNLDPYMGDVLAEKLEEFPDKKEYLKKDADMKMLTSVETKVKLGQKLNQEDLVFLYEINSPIEGFGYQKDPRIAEIRAARNSVEDAPIVFNYSPDQITTSVQGITENTKAYIGPLEKGIFAKLPSTVEHVYTKFPDNKIRYAQLDASVEYPKDAKGWADAFEKQDIKLEDQNINKMLEKMEATNLPEDQKFVILKVADLGFDKSTRYDALCEKAESLGLELCSQDDGPKLRLSMDQQNGTYVRTAMKSIDLGGGDLRLWFVRRNDDGLRWLYWIHGNVDNAWGTGNAFAFRVRKS